MLMFDNIIKQKDLERDQLQNDIAKFLSSGGEITQLEDWVDKPNKKDGHICPVSYHPEVQVAYR